METPANGYSSDRTQQGLSNEYQHDRVLNGFQKYLHPWALDKSSLSIGKDNTKILLIRDPKTDHTWLSLNYPHGKWILDESFAYLYHVNEDFKIQDKFKDVSVKHLDFTLW